MRKNCSPTHLSDFEFLVVEDAVYAIILGQKSTIK